MKMHRYDDLMNQLRGLRTHHNRAQDLAASSFHDKLDETLDLSAYHRFPMVKKRVVCDTPSNPLLLGFALSKANHGELRLWKHRKKLEPIVNCLESFSIQKVLRIASRDFALLNRNMNNLMQPRNIARCENMWLRCLHHCVNRHRFAPAETDSGFP